MPTEYKTKPRLVQLRTLGAAWFFVLLFLFFARSPLASGAVPWNALNLEKIQSERAASGESETFSFVVVGDTQGPNSKFPRVLSKILSEEDLLFAFDLGDLVNYATDAEYEDTFFRRVRNLDLPFLACASNHDHFKSKGAANYSRLFGSPHYYSFKIANVSFIVLDNGQDYSMTEEQLEWFERELELSRNSALRFVMMHRPLRDPRPNRKRPHDMNENEVNKKEAYARAEVNIARLLALFDAYKVTMVFTGHIHSFYEGRWGGTPYIITGGGGGGLHDRGTSASFHHYVRVDVSDGAARYKVVKVAM
ncbi:metallophosphoesterase [Synergistales bacterium]|nr:metallophosphoesterase [Synergistales bacterium]